jgi:hypothetical protein
MHVATSAADAVDLFVTVALETPTWPDGSIAAPPLEVAVFDQRGNPVAKASFDRAPSGAHGGGGHYEHTLRFSVSPGRYEVRAASAVDGLSGSVFVPVEARQVEHGSVGISDWLVAMMQRATSEDVTFGVDLVPEQLTTRRTFSPDDEVAAFVHLLPSGAAGIDTLGVSVRFDGPTTIETRRFPVAAAYGAAPGSRLDLMIPLPLESLSPGDYRLSLVVEGNGLANAERRLFFSVR